MSYIGEREVKSIDGTTVTFVDETTQVLTERQLEYMVTEVPADASALQMMLIPNVLPDMCEAIKGINLSDTPECIMALIPVLEKHDIRRADIAFVINNFTAIMNAISR
jgi:hypothetical protein